MRKITVGLVLQMWEIVSFKILGQIKQKIHGGYMCHPKDKGMEYDNIQECCHMGLRSLKSYKK